MAEHSFQNDYSRSILRCMRRPCALFLLAAVLATACQTSPRQGQPIPDDVVAPGVRTFGTMREVMRDGQSEARVALHGLATKHTIGVGALAGLQGEVTIVDGEVLVATVTAEQAITRAASKTDQATLLVCEDVAAWHHFEVGDCESYEQLEGRLAELLRARGHDLQAPTPVRVHGTLRRLQVHVLAGACPIANPSGPSPWRYDGPAYHAQLVGFYVEGAAGRLTHHNHNSHLHATSDQAMGHLDGVELLNAIVSLPASRGR